MSLEDNYGPEDTILLPWQLFYHRLNEIAGTQLKKKYDHIFFVMRGGMAVAHRLAQILEVSSGGFNMSPIYIRRHASNTIHSEQITPVLKEQIKSEKIRQQDVLIVEDTVGTGDTVLTALHEINKHCPKSVDVFTVGLDHSMSHTWLSDQKQNFIADLVVGFDYWGWLVLPWENEQEEAEGATQLNQSEKALFLHDYFQTRNETWQTYREVLSLYVSKMRDALSTFSKIIVIVPELDYTPRYEHFFKAEGITQEGINFVSVRELLHGDAILCEPVDAIIAFGLYPSLEGSAKWKLLLNKFHELLQPQGSILFDYLNRSYLTQKQIVDPNTYYYSKSNIDRLSNCCHFKAHDRIDIKKSISSKGTVEDPFHMAISLGEYVKSSDVI